MATELQRCEERKLQSGLQLREAVVRLLSPDRGSVPERADRFMQYLDSYVDAKMDLREAEAEERAAASRDY